jgi:hypothetical protein
MRYQTDQPLVSRLIEALEIETRPFESVHGDNRLVLRGRISKAADAGVAGDAYDLAPDEAGHSAGELIVSAFERLVPDARHLDAARWNEARRETWHGDRPLADWSIGEALASVLSPDAHRFVTDAFGYDSGLTGFNAADAIPYLLGGNDPNATSRTPVDGMDRLPRELAERFERGGGTIRLEFELAAIETEPTAAQGQLWLHFTNGSTVRARRVVLALPKPALTVLSASTPFLRQPEIHDFLEAVEAWQAAKLYLWYDRAWWRDDGFRGRRTTTDLPARKLFYFDGHGAGDPSVLLAAYTDGGDVEPWRAVSDGAAAGSQAPSAMLKLVNQQLAIIHPGVEIPDPAGSAFVHWGADPLEAGWHYWRAGARSWDVMPAVLRPDPTRSAYICGEAYSTSQAWVEGALETAAMVVGRVLSD